MINHEILSIMDIETVNNEIKSREHLLTLMVGSLYPAIINDELDQLHARLEQLCINNIKPEN